MNAAEVKRWALEVIDRVKSQKPVEDTRVECKASWVEPYSIARQFAGHANAAKGESILWLMGIDEKQGIVTGVDRNDLANWYPQLVKNFDGVAPSLLADLNLDVDSKTVVALMFDTSNAPFVIKVPNTDRLEIPWRQGTRTRSANRSEVLRIFSFVQAQGALVPLRVFTDESPRAQNLAIERPPYWEYLLTLELLWPKLRYVRRKYDDVRAGRILQRARILSGKDFYSILKEKMNDLESWMQVMKFCAETEIPASWGEPGEPGDPIEIKHAVDRFIHTADALVQWEGDILSLRPPELFRDLQALLNGTTASFLESMEKFAQLLGEPFEAGEPTPGTVVNLRLIIDFPDGKIDEIHSEMERVTTLLERDPERWLEQWNNAF